MGAKFFSHRTPGRTRGAGGQVRFSETGSEGLDRQQALVLGALRRAAGAPVSYAELREVGVELPASVVSELELAGVAVERCVGHGRGGVGVRLDPADDPAVRRTPEPVERPTPTDAEAEAAWSSVRMGRALGLEGLFFGVAGRVSRSTGKSLDTGRHRGTGRGRGTAARPAPVGMGPVRVDRRSRFLALAALLAGIAVVVAFVAMFAPGGGQRTRVPVAKRSHWRLVVAAGGRRPASAPRATHPSPRVGVSPALATELEAQGHSLLKADRYGDAVPVLKRAVLATGETLGACLEPASSTCLTYAYALYDLGRAVPLSGAPRAAVAILERRLQIDNQRSIVAVELQLAHQGIG